MIRTGLSLAALALAISPAAAQVKPTSADADKFVARAEKELADFSLTANKMQWVNATFITDDTDALAGKINGEQTELQVKYALEAAKYAGVAGLSPDTRRKLDLLRGTITLPAPTKPGAAE